MLSYSRGPDVPLLDQTLFEALQATARRIPDRDALISMHQNIRLSFAELVGEVERTARALLGLGLQSGDRVGVWATNCVEWVLIQFAAVRTGIILVNVNPAYRAHELAWILRKSRMKALFLAERDLRSDYAGILDDARESCGGEALALRHVVYLHADSWEAFRSRESKLPDAHPDPGDVTNIQYTSGTTGSPKGVLLTHRNLLNNAQFISQALGLHDRDRLCLPVPLYHCFGCVGGSLVMAATGVAMILPAPQFDAACTLRAIHEERASVIYGVPTMFIAQLNHPDFAKTDFSSLRTGIMSGAPCPIGIMRRVVDEMRCAGMLVVYGQTEASPVITGCRSDDSLEVRTGTVGRALPSTEVKIAGADGQPLPVGEQGELCTRGYLVMAGYDDEPEATRRAIDGDGWLHTGDLATMREDGNFRITGRSRDMIIRGGENIYPREVEEFLFTHPKVADVQVVGLPHADLGESVAAWIRLKPGESGCVEEFREFCRGQIAHFKIPQHIRFTDTFPMTVTGKIQKFRIREIEIEALGLRAAAAIEMA